MLPIARKRVSLRWGGGGVRCWLRLGLGGPLLCLQWVIGSAWGLGACPVDCNEDGVVDTSELVEGRDDVLWPDASGLPRRCPNVDYDRDGDYGVEDLIRGATARRLSCREVVNPAGWRGSVVDASSWASLLGAVLAGNRWPPPGTPGHRPDWAWPGLSRRRGHRSRATTRVAPTRPWCRGKRCDCGRRV
ncbi:MAG: hypothetical protein KatS3mg077_0769 [Candidatus Binatia bacterium]|nr:MAG: hypothetical protein KatS3mg077_0769 [Candidatus Binatia bacterium]